jgi:hypothetical protein
VLVGEDEVLAVPGVVGLEDVGGGHAAPCGSLNSVPGGGPAR